MRAVTVACLCLMVLLVAWSGCARQTTPAEGPKMPPQAGQPAPQPTAPSTAGDLGRTIFETGIGESGQHIAFAEGSDRFKAKPGGCVNCHGEDGRGKQLGKLRTPAIHYSALRGGAAPLYPSDAAVAKSVR